MCRVASRPFPDLSVLLRADWPERVRAVVNECIHVYVRVQYGWGGKIIFTLNPRPYSVISDAVGPTGQPGQYPGDKLCLCLHTISPSLKSVKGA